MQLILGRSLQYNVLNLFVNHFRFKMITNSQTTAAKTSCENRLFTNFHSPYSKFIITLQLIYILYIFIYLPVLTEILLVF